MACKERVAQPRENPKHYTVGCTKLIVSCQKASVSVEQTGALIKLLWMVHISAGGGGGG